MKTYDFRYRQFLLTIILQCMRWYLRYPMSYRNLEEMMIERSVDVDHTTLYRWMQKYVPQLEKRNRRIKRRIRPMLGFKTFNSAKRIIRGIEAMNMIVKRQSCFFARSIHDQIYFINRLVVQINYNYKIVFIRFIGTHKEYDQINAEEI